MLIANVDEQPTFATATGQRGRCSCGAMVMSKVGRLITAHWSHFSGSECTVTEPETPWHMAWKRAVAGDDPARCERPYYDEAGKVVHRADALGGDGGVVEVQHSPISCADIGDREAFYSARAGAMCWVFDYTTRAWPPVRGDSRITYARCVRLVDTASGVHLLEPGSTRAWAVWTVERAQAVLRDEGVAGVVRAYRAHVEAVLRAEEERARAEEERRQREALETEQAEYRRQVRELELRWVAAQRAKIEREQREAREVEHAAERKKREEQAQRERAEMQRILQEEAVIREARRVEEALKAEEQRRKDEAAEKARVERARARRDTMRGGAIVNRIDAVHPGHSIVVQFDRDGGVHWRAALSILFDADGGLRNISPDRFPPVSIPPDEVNMVGMGVIEKLWPYLDEATDRDLRRRWRHGSATIPRPPEAKQENLVLDLFG